MDPGNPLAFLGLVFCSSSARSSHFSNGTGISRRGVVSIESVHAAGVS